MYMCTVQRGTVEFYGNADGCCTTPDILWYGVGCLPSGAVHVSQNDVINREDVIDRFLHPVPPYCNAVAPSHYVL